MEGCPKALMINFDLKEISSIEEDAFEKPLSAVSYPKDNKLNMHIVYLIYFIHIWRRYLTLS